MKKNVLHLSLGKYCDAMCGLSRKKVFVLPLTIRNSGSIEKYVMPHEELCETCQLIHLSKEAGNEQDFR